MPADEANDYIELDQFLKLMNVVSSGGEAKHRIRNGEVQVNGEVDTRRKRKLRTGDQVLVDGNNFVVEELKRSG